MASDYGISIAGVYYPANGQLAEIPGSGGVSPVDAPRSTRSLEAMLSNDWFRTITPKFSGNAAKLIVWGLIGSLCYGV